MAGYLGVRNISTFAPNFIIWYWIKVYENYSNLR